MADVTLIGIVVLLFAVGFVVGALAVGGIRRWSNSRRFKRVHRKLGRRP